MKLKTPGGPSSERGQVILIGSLTVALALVALVLAVNGVLFAKNVESEGVDPFGDEANEFERVVRTEVGRTLVQVNQNVPSSAADARTETRENIEGTSGIPSSAQRISQALRQLSVGESGELTNVSIPPPYTSSIQTGTMIRQTSTEAMDQPNLDANGIWTVGTGTDLRRLQIGVQRTDLQTFGSPGTAATSTDTFRVTISDGAGETRSVYIYQDGSDEIVVVKEDPTPTVTRTEHRITTDSAYVDVTTGSVNGNSQFDLGLGSGPYTVTFGGGNDNTGNYSMTFDGYTNSGLITFSGSPTDRTPAVWSTDVRLQYRTTTFSYDRTMTLEPCSMDAERCQFNGVSGVTSFAGGAVGSGGGGSGSPPSVSGVSLDDAVCYNGKCSQATVGYSASDPDGNLNQIIIKVYDTSTGTKVREQTFSPGSSSSDVDFSCGNRIDESADYRFEVIAEDTSGNSDSADTVEKPSNVGPTSGSGCPPTESGVSWQDATCSGSTCSEVEVDWTANDVDGDLDTVTVELYTQGGSFVADTVVNLGGVGSANGPTAITGLSVNKNDKYYFEVTAADQQGQTVSKTTADKEPGTYSTTDNPPTINSVQWDGYSCSGGCTVNAKWDVSDDNEIDSATVELVDDSGTTVRSDTISYGGTTSVTDTKQFTGVSSGKYHFELTATDSASQTDTGSSTTKDIGSVSNNDPQVVEAKWVSGSCSFPCPPGNPTYQIESYWEVEDNNDNDLSKVTLELYKNGSIVSGKTQVINNPTPSGDSGYYTFTVNDGSADYYVKVIVEDSGGKTASKDTSEEKPGNI